MKKTAAEFGCILTISFVIYYL